MTDLIRAPNHLGDFVLSLPALEAAPRADIQVAQHLEPLARLALPGRVILPLNRGPGGFARAVLQLRSRSRASATLLTPSFSSALLVALAGIPGRRGTSTDHRGALLTDSVDPVQVDTVHRSTAYLLLVTGAAPAQAPVPLVTLDDSAQKAWSALRPFNPPFVGVVPGSRASARRWNPERFREITRRLADAGHRVIVFGGPEERRLTEQVAGKDAADLGGRCSLPALAAGLAECRWLLTNDSGPMHLAAAVRTPTVSLWGAGDPQHTGPLGPGHRLLRRTDLPCVPCVRNACPRRGKGTILPEAERECMALLEVDQVWREITGASR
ncbi:MAG TPA: glycosyltransferase family 9 protein [Gemmatimonadales bacterium]|jgi:heptosyltransferase-2